jgi:hypothetical protein
MSGWYQGSGYLILAGNCCPVLRQTLIMFPNVLILGLLNFQWAQNPGLLNEPLGRAIAALLSAIAWTSSGWYLWRGLISNGVIIAAAGLFQAWAALR